MALVHEVIVIDDHREIVRDVVDVIDQSADQGLQLAIGLGHGGQSSFGSWSKVRELLADAGHKIFQKDPGVTVGLVHGIPADGEIGVVGKVHQKRGLSIASRSGDKNQLAIYVLVDKVHQTLTVQKAGLLSGEKDLGDRDWGCLWHFGLLAGDLERERYS
jgi:hypothetical protein